MDCDQALRRLGDYLDHELDDPEQAELERHLEVCDECVRKFAFEADLLRSLRARLGRSALPLGLRTRVTEVLIAARSNETWRRRNDPGRTDG